MEITAHPAASHTLNCLAGINTFGCDHTPVEPVERPTISARLNPRAASVCEAHGLSLHKARYYVASHCPWDRPDTHVMLGFTDDIEQALTVRDALVPAVPGERFTVRAW